MDEQNSREKLRDKLTELFEQYGEHIGIKPDIYNDDSGVNAFYGSGDTTMEISNYEGFCTPEIAELNVCFFDTQAMSKLREKNEDTQKAKTGIGSCRGIPYTVESLSDLVHSAHIRSIAGKEDAIRLLLRS